MVEGAGEISDWLHCITRKVIVRGSVGPNRRGIIIILVNPKFWKCG